MKDRPIILSGEMVNAILDGRKTQTRRVVKPQPAWIYDGVIPVRTADADPEGAIRCPYGQTGDHLWVREAWRIGAWEEDDGAIAVDYRADGHCRREWLSIPEDDDGEIFNRYWEQSTHDARKTFGNRDRYEWEPGQSPCRWRPAIHMPRWASRIDLEIPDVRVERVQDISEEDARAEGVDYRVCGGPNDRAAFCRLWNSLNAKRGFGWDTNPYVWAISFRRIK